VVRICIMFQEVRADQAGLYCGEDMYYVSGSQGRPSRTLLW
jgi:hypothetical protein